MKKKKISSRNLLYSKLIDDNFELKISRKRKIVKILLKMCDFLFKIPDDPTQTDTFDLANTILSNIFLGSV